MKGSVRKNKGILKWIAGHFSVFIKMSEPSDEEDSDINGTTDFDKIQSQIEDVKENGKFGFKFKWKF